MTNPFWHDGNGLNAIPVPLRGGATVSRMNLHTSRGLSRIFGKKH
ncbi:MAG: hypothetical protein M0037_15885 [Betaproteobacteria bacterium]|jgi:hypothetical protein|nr:hypothetical protein [Betaproteobacteria bacterium]